MKASEQQALIPQEATPDLAQRILDAGLAMENMCAKPATSRQMILIDDLRRSLDMEDGDVEASIDPDTGEIG